MALPELTALRFGPRVIFPDMLQIVVCKSRGLALTANTDNLCDAELDEMLEILIQGMVGVAPVKC
jgi:hypothetical protein